MLIRPALGSLDKAMVAVKEIPNTVEAVREWAKKQYVNTITNEMLEVIEWKHHCYDDRIDWDTYIVKCKSGVLGYTNGPIEKEKEMQATTPVHSKTIVTSIYYSDRNHQLLYLGAPIDKPIITLENYTKWYGIYMVMPNGKVEQVPDDILSQAVDSDKPHCGVLDHLFHPQVIYEVARLLNAEYCERSIEVATGRWILESNRLEEVAEQFHPPRDED